MAIPQIIKDKLIQHANEKYYELAKASERPDIINNLRDLEIGIIENDGDDTPFMKAIKAAKQHEANERIREAIRGSEHSLQTAIGYLSLKAEENK